jgi:hypothetical protein
MVHFTLYLRGYLPAFVVGWRCGIYAVTQPRGRRSIVEDVAKMSVTGAAQHLYSLHPQAIVGLCADILLRDRLIKTGPTGAGLELGAGTEQGGTATHALIHARVVGTGIFAGVRTLGAFLAGDPILLGSKLLSPFSIGLSNFACHCNFSIHTFWYEFF